MKKNKLRALSIAQPWAELIVSHGKNVENRSWSTKMRGYIAIHASAGYSADRYDYANTEYGFKYTKDSIPRGAILGFAKISAVITKKEVTRKTKKWFQGDYGFVLENVIKLKSPVPAKGSLSFWRLTSSQEKKCLGQLTAKQRKEILENIIE